MIHWRGYGNLLLDTDATQLCPINAMGAMGKGLALTMRQAYPWLYVAYRDTFHPTFSPEKDIQRRARQLKLVSSPDNPSLSVLLFCTKYDWKEASSMSLIDANLRYLASHWQELGIQRLSLPLVGTGEGRLSPRTIEYLIDRYLGAASTLPIRLYLGT